MQVGGFRLLFYWIRNQGKKWNGKRVYRVYKAENLNLRTPKVRKKIKRVAINPLPAQQINQVWSMDFLSDVLLSNEKKVRILNVLDECFRKELLCFAAASIKGWCLDFLLDDVVAEIKAPILNVMDEYSRKFLMADAKTKQLITALENPVATYGKLEYILCDNYPELVSKKKA